MFRDLMLGWLTVRSFKGVESENGRHASGHSALGHDGELAFALQSWIFFFFFFALTFASHGGTARERSAEIKRIISRQWRSCSVGCKQLWHKWDMSITRCKKRESCLLCIFCIMISVCVTTTFHWLGPSGLSLVWHCTAVCQQLSPCCFYYLWLLCGWSRVGASDHRCTIAVSSASPPFSTCGWIGSLQNLL